MTRIQTFWTGLTFMCAATLAASSVFPLAAQEIAQIQESQETTQFVQESQETTQPVQESQEIAQIQESQETTQPVQEPQETTQFVEIDRRPERRPNIFFFFADDWGKYASVYTENKINAAFQTPTLDSLAREGVRFSNAHVNAPTCTASRSALFSGQYFYRTGYGAFLYAKQWDDSIPTFPLLLEEAGYCFGFSNKGWGPGNPANRPLGGKRNQFQKRGSRFNQFSQNVTKMVADGVSIADAKRVLYEEALGNFDDFLKTRVENQPFCYYFGPTNTHRDWVKGSGKTLWGIEPDDLEGKLPAFIPDVPEIREDVADYLGEVKALDGVLALFLAKLEEMGELENTLVVVSGDHGIPGFPRAKANLYDIGTSVSLFVRWGDEIAPKREITDFVNLMDLAPTFLEVAGAEIPDCMTGRSLLPLLKSERSGRIDPRRDAVITGRERHVMTARTGNLPYPSRALQTDEFLYVRNFAPERAPLGEPIPLRRTKTGASELYASPLADLDGGPTKTWIIEHYFDSRWKSEIELSFGYRPAEELYNLKNDPDCLRNLAADPEFRDVLNEYGNRLTTVLTETKDPRVAPGICVFDAPEFVERWSKWRIPSPEDLRAQEN